MDMPLSEVKVLTDRLLRSWVRCRRKAWLDLHGDETKRLWSAHRTLQLDHQQKSFAALITQQPGSGKKALQEGYLGVVGVRLKGITTKGFAVEAHPPLLQKIKGRSRWGEFAFRPVLARQGKKITREIRLSLALTALLLEKEQGAYVNNSLVI